MENELSLAEKKRGRKPSGSKKVVYYRRIDPALVCLMDDYLRRGGKVGDKVALVEVQEGPAKVDPLALAANPPSKDVLALLNDVDRLEKEKVELLDKVQRIARLTDNEKLILWIRKYDALKAEYDKKVGSGEFSQ